LHHCRIEALLRVCLQQADHLSGRLVVPVLLRQVVHFGANSSGLGAGAWPDGKLWQHAKIILTMPCGCGTHRRLVSAQVRGSGTIDCHFSTPTQHPLGCHQTSP